MGCIGSQLQHLRCAVVAVKVYLEVIVEEEEEEENKSEQCSRQLAWNEIAQVPTLHNPRVPLFAERWCACQVYMQDETLAHNNHSLEVFDIAASSLC